MRKWIPLAAAAAVSVLAVRSSYERTHFVVTDYYVETEKLGRSFDGFQIAFLTDLHDASYGPQNQRLVEALQERKPDWILIGGDMMITKEWSSGNFAGLQGLLQQLVLICPVFYGNGNHEQRMREEPENYPGWYEAFLTILKECGVTYLSNESLCFSGADGAMSLTGLDLGNQFYQKFTCSPMKPDYIEGQVGVPVPDAYRILLAHNPQYFRMYAEWGADLVLSGHCHGGTIRIPLLGGLMSPQFRFFQGNDRGISRIRDSVMAVSAGLGTHSINIRLNNRPEIVMVTLKSGRISGAGAQGELRRE